ncbi:MAG: Riboflavin transporter [Eubacteriales bacterium SKADARSKE-1]|nr:Riboflavin transporter [Eubacteriales bacterium SKADARSKE-1]
MKSEKVLFLTQTAFFGIIAAIIMLFEFPIFFVPGFYKLNFGDTIVLIGGFILGPVAGIMIEFIKTILFILIRGTSTLFIGEAASFVTGCAFILPSCIIYKKKRTLESAIRGMLLGIISLMMVSGCLNYFILLPLYSRFFGLPIQKFILIANLVNSHIHNLFTFTIFAVIPFNFIRGTISCFAAIVIYKKTSRFIEKIVVKTKCRNKL